MKKNKFMTRVFSAMENQETEVLDQIQNDLEIAKEDGELDSEEYKITWDPDQEVFVLHDKINNEHTEISEDEEAAFYMTDMTDANAGIPTPEESIPELSVNDEVKWTDELGHEHQGMITMISDGIATILENEVEVAAPIESLMKVEAPAEEHDFSFVDKTFAKVQDYYMVALDKETKLLHCKWLLETDKKSDAIEEYEKRSRTWTWDKNYKDLGLKSRDQITKIKGVDNINWYSSVGKTFSHIDSPESLRSTNGNFSSHKNFSARNVTADELIEFLGPESEPSDMALRKILSKAKKFYLIAPNHYHILTRSALIDLQYCPDEDKLLIAAYDNKSGKGTCLSFDANKSDSTSMLREFESYFSIHNKRFSKITTEEEFREYAHKVMKEAHGDDYSEEATNNVVDDLLADNPNNDYGELIGRLTSGFGEKNFSFSESNDERKAVVVRDRDYNYQIISIKSREDEEKVNQLRREGYIIDRTLADSDDAKDYVKMCKEELARRGQKGFSFVEKTFAKSDAVKKLEFEVSRIKDLYDDVKARQKGETDPVMKSRNKMLLQEIKVKLEQAKLAVYKKEFEESRSKNFSFVEKTFSEEFNQPTANLKRAASQWARDLNLGHKGVELMIAAWTEGRQDEFDRLKDELEVPSKDFRIFEEKYYDPNTDELLY